MELQSHELITSIFRSHLEPDETELYLISGQREYSSSIRFIPYIGKLICAIKTKNIILGLTNRRILIMEISLHFDLDEKNLRSIEFSEIRNSRIEEPILAKIMPLPIVEKTLCITLNTGEEYRIKALNTTTQEKDLKEICTMLKGISDRGNSSSEVDIEEMPIPKEIRKSKWPKVEKRNETAMSLQDMPTDTGEYDESEKYYVKAIEINPKNPLAHYNYANLLEDAGRFEEAARHYVEAIEISPGFAGLYKRKHARVSKKFLNVLGGTVVFVVLMLLFYSLIYLIKKGIWGLIFG